MSKSMTVSQLVAAAVAIVGNKMDEVAIRATLKAENVRSQKRIVEVFTPLAAPAETAKTPRYRSERIIEAGPRGFRFSTKFIDSVKAADGIAVHPSNFPKLRAYAESVGVAVDGNRDAVEIAKLAAAAAGTTASA